MIRRLLSAFKIMREMEKGKAFSLILFKYFRSLPHFTLYLFIIDYWYRETTVAGMEGVICKYSSLPAELPPSWWMAAV